MKSISTLDEMTSVIQSLLKIYKEISSEKVKDEIKKTIHTLLSPDLWGQKHAVSKRAQEFADSKGYTKDLSISSWNQLDNGKLRDDNKKGHNGKRGLILEHILLRSDIMDLLLKCDHANSNKIKAIVGNTRCAVIHWQEDDELNNKGYGNKRPDPKEAYEKAGIKLVGYKDISDFIDSNWVNENIKSLYM